MLARFTYGLLARIILQWGTQKSSSQGLGSEGGWPWDPIRWISGSGSRQ